MQTNPAALLSFIIIFLTTSWFMYNFVSNDFHFPWEKMSKYAEIFILKSDFSNVPPMCHIRDKRWKKPSSGSDKLPNSQWAGGKGPMKQSLSDAVLYCNRGTFPMTDRTGKKKKSTTLGTLRPTKPCTLSSLKNLNSLTSKVLKNFQMQMPES